MNTEIANMSYEFENLLYIRGWKSVGSNSGRVNERFKLKCGKNHSFLMSMKMLKMGEKCPDCEKDEAKEKYTKMVEEAGWKIVGKYVSKKNTVLLSCGNNHITQIVAGKFNKAYQCMYCNVPNVNIENKMRVENVDEDFSIFDFENDKDIVLRNFETTSSSSSDSIPFYDDFPEKLSIFDFFLPLEDDLGDFMLI